MLICSSRARSALFVRSTCSQQQSSVLAFSVLRKAHLDVRDWGFATGRTARRCLPRQLQNARRADRVSRRTGEIARQLLVDVVRRKRIATDRTLELRHRIRHHLHDFIMWRATTGSAPYSLSLRVPQACSACNAMRASNTVRSKHTGAGCCRDGLAASALLAAIELCQREPGSRQADRRWRAAIIGRVCCSTGFVLSVNGLKRRARKDSCQKSELADTHGRMRSLVRETPRLASLLQENHPHCSHMPSDSHRSPSSKAHLR